MNRLAQGSMKVGELIVFVGKLQLFWFALLFRYFIIAGIFPATAAVIHQFFKVFEDSSIMENLTWSIFKQSAKDNFKRSNQVGYISLIIMAVLYVDQRIAFVLAHNIYVAIMLIVLMVIAFGTLLYIIPAVVRYDLTLVNAFRQAFFLLLSNLMNTIAMLIGMFLALALGIAIPVLVLIPVPLFFLSNAWFSYQAMRKLEKANEVE